jgi:hypothetical protein
MSIFRESIGETLIFEGEKPYAEPAPGSVYSFSINILIGGSQFGLALGTVSR